MTNRIDHAAEAVGLLALAAAGVRDRRYLIAAAHIHATLAVAEQARIANEQMAEVIAHVLGK